MLRRLLLSSLIILATVKLLNAQPPGSFGRMRVEFETPQHIICDTGCSGSAATGDLLGTYGPTTFTSNDQFLGPVTVPTGTRTILISTMTQNYNGRLALEANSGDGGFSLGTTFLAVKEVSSENARSFSNSTQVMFWSGGATYGRLFSAIDVSPQIVSVRLHSTNYVSGTIDATLYFYGSDINLSKYALFGKGGTAWSGGFLAMGGYNQGSSLPVQLTVSDSGPRYDTLAAVTTRYDLASMQSRTSDGSGNYVDSATANPAGTERGLITRNIPSGIQTVQWTNPAVSSATLTSTTCPGTGCLAVSSLTQASMATVGITGTFTGSAVLNFDISEDGTNFGGTVCLQGSNVTNISNYSVTSASYEIVYCPLYGQISDFRVRMTLAPATGSVVVRITTTSDPITFPAYVVKQGQSGNSASTSWYTQITDNAFNGPAKVKPASTAAVATDPSLVVALSPNTSLPSGANILGSVSQNGSWTVTTTPPTNASTNVAQFGGTNVVTGTGAGGAGIPRVTISNDSSLAANQSVNLAQVGGTNTVNGGLAGSLSVGGTAGNNAAITQNPLVLGLEARSTAPTQATNGNQIRSTSDLAGNQFNVLPLSWTCNLQALAATLTQCQAAPAASYSLYVTAIIATTTTGTAGTFAIRYGTGTNCATGTTGVWPQPGGASPSRTTTAPISTAAPMVINLGPVGWKVPAANAVCVIGTATNTIDISLSGFIAP